MIRESLLCPDESQLTANREDDNDSEEQGYEEEARGLSEHLRKIYEYSG